LEAEQARTGLLAVGQTPNRSEPAEPAEMIEREPLQLARVPFRQSVPYPGKIRGRKLVEGQDPLQKLAEGDGDTPHA
jgi:hypothetical protein